MNQALLRTSIILILFAPRVWSYEIEWRPEWSFNKMTDAVTCNVFSTRFPANENGKLNWLYLGVQGNNLVTIHSVDGVFDPMSAKLFGIRVGKNTAVLSAVQADARMAIFNDAQSQEIIKELSVEHNLVTQVAYFPKQVTVNSTLESGREFKSFLYAINSKKACDQIKDTTGWVGVLLQDMGLDENYKTFLNKSGITGPGVIVWTVDPRKAAAAAEIKAYDIILSVEDIEYDTKGLLSLFSSLNPGDKIKIKILRENDIETVSLKR